jgi:twitching motility protein PilT
MAQIGLKDILKEALAGNAADIHICAHAPVVFRVGRDLVPIRAKNLTPDEAHALSYQLMNDEQRRDFERECDVDFMLMRDGSRYRVNVSRNHGAVGAVIRILDDRPRMIEDLGLPPILKSFCELQKGLVLITGATSQGKTTTLSALIHEINCAYQRHIITIEDPIEYIHHNRKSIVRQRRVGADTKSFATGLRAALRQDPDVIAIGEMRDFETFQTALVAASTGVLVFSTLHTISIDKVIERLVSYGSAEFEMHIRFLLADAVQAIVHQELVSTVTGGRAVACEVLIANDAARNTFRKSGAFMLRNIITTSGRQGMTTMRQSIGRLLDAGLITTDQARSILVYYP